jgi:hypothetical protein
MIFKDYDSAYEYASKNAHVFDGLDMLADGTFRVRLEGQDPVECCQVLSSSEPSLPEYLEKIEIALSKVGAQDLPVHKKPWHPMSSFWRKMVSRSYYFNKPQLVARVGRRGGKSSTLCRIAVGEAAFGDHPDSASERGYFAIISAELKQAQERILTCSRILDVLGIENKTIKDMIDLKGMNRGIRVFTATVQGVVSFRCIGAICDEVAHWKDKDAGRNPATEVFANLRPTMFGNPNAKLWMISAPYSVFDEHYAAYEKGTDLDQTCFYAPTWVANDSPEYAEAKTHRMERDPIMWRCQYAAIPLPSSADTFFPADLVEEARKLTTPALDKATLVRTAGGDFAFVRNSSALVCVLAGEDPVTRLVTIKVKLVQEWIPVESSLRPGKVLKEVIELAEGLSCTSLCCDKHYSEMVREKLEDTRLELMDFPSHEKAEAYIFCRVLLSEGRLDLTRANEKLITQLKATLGQPMSDGIKITNPEVRGAHGDLVDALVCAVYASMGGDMSRGDMSGGDRRFDKLDYSDDSEWVEHSDDYNPSLTLG